MNTATPTCDHLRTVIFRPYTKNHGPTFRLQMWGTNRRNERGGTLVAYRLSSGGVTIFEGDDFGPSPLHGHDSDQAVVALMGFLTLRPDDTDADYFKDYTPVQHAFADEHAETLAAEVYARFGDD